MFVKKTLSHNSQARITKSIKVFNVKSPTYYFHMKMKVLVDFQICISVPLIGYNLKAINLRNLKLGIIRHQSFLLKTHKNHLENLDCIHCMEQYHHALQYFSIAVYWGKVRQ